MSKLMILTIALCCHEILSHILKYLCTESSGKCLDSRGRRKL